MYENLRVLNAILYMAENGNKWRRLPKEVGNWHTIYLWMSRWSKAGVLDRNFGRLQKERILRVKTEIVSLDSTSSKVHPDWTGAFKKKRHRPLAFPEAEKQPRFIWLPRILNVL